MIMNSLVKLSSTPSFTYDWNQITNHQDRAVAHTAVDTYAKQHKALRAKAEEIIKEDNLAKSQCVYKLKLALPHGQFLDVCQQALGLNSQTAAALATSGKLLTESSNKAEVLELFKVMEPRAGRQFLLLDEKSKIDYVVKFEETGRVPSQRDFINRTKDDVLPSSTKKKPSPTTRMSTSDFDRLTAVMQQNKISAADLLKWLATAFTNKEPSEATKALVYEVSYAVLGEK